MEIDATVAALRSDLVALRAELERCTALLAAPTREAQVALKPAADGVESARGDADGSTDGNRTAAALPEASSLAARMRRAAPRPQDLFDELALLDDEARTRRWRLEGFDEVLARCGAPDDVSASPYGELVWTYREAATERQLTFSFVGGLVVRVAQ